MNDRAKSIDDNIFNRGLMMPEAPKGNAFHAHLDGCKQCRDHPMQLCAVGARLLREAAVRS